MDEIDDDIPKEINCYKIGQFLYSYRNIKVYLGINSLTNKEVTIKIINKKYISGNPKLLTYLNNDILYTKISCHNNILKLLETHETSSYVFIIMEIFKGEFLSSYMNKNKKLEESKALKIFSKIISAMSYIHNMNICHLNINLESILIDENDENLVKIIDFKYGQYYYTKFKPLNFNIGTNMFTAPEIFSIDTYYPELADVWSCGILLCYLLKGDFPINYNKELGIEERYSIPKDINEDLQDLLKNILCIDTDKRYRFDDIIECKYFTERNINNEIIEENENNYSIENVELRKIYERYLKTKVLLGKADNPNVLVNFEILIHRELLPDDKRMSKLIEKFGKRNNDNNTLPKRNYVKVNKKKGKEENNNNENNNETNKDKTFLPKKKDTFTEFKFNKNKVINGNNKTNNSNKKKVVNGKRKSVFEIMNRFPQKSFLFEIPENLILEKEDFKSHFINNKIKETDNNKHEFTGRSNIKNFTKLEKNPKLIGQKIASSSAGRRRRTQFAVVGEQYSDFNLFSEIIKKKKTKDEEKNKMFNFNKDKIGNEKELKRNSNIDDNLNINAIINEKNKENKENKNELEKNEIQNKPLFNFDELYEDIEETEKEEENKNNEENTKDNVIIIESNEDDKSNNENNEIYKSSSKYLGDILGNKNTQSNVSNADIKENNSIINESTIRENENFSENSDTKKSNNRDDQFINNSKTLPINNKKDIKNLQLKNNDEKETDRYLNTIKIENRYKQIIKNNNISKTEKKQQKKSSIIKNNKMNNLNLSKQNKSTDKTSEFRALNSELVQNKSTDDIIEIRKNKTNNKKLFLNTKLNKEKYLSNYDSKTPSNQKGTSNNNRLIKNCLTLDNISQKRLISNNKLNEERNESPHFYNKNDKKEKNYENQEENDILAPYFSNIKIKEKESDEEGSIQEKSTKNLNKFQGQINRRQTRIIMEKAVIKKFIKRTTTKTPVYRSKKRSLFSNYRKEKKEDKSNNDDKSVNDKSNKNSIVSEFNIGFESSKNIYRKSSIYDAILKNLRDVNDSFEKNGENDRYIKFIRRKITPDKNKSINENKNNIKKRNRNDMKSNSDRSNSSISKSSSRSESNINSKKKNHKYKNKGNYLNNNEKKNRNKNKNELFKNIIINNIKNKYNSKKSDRINDNNSSSDNSINDNNNNKDIFKDVDNFNFINNEYKDIKSQMNKNNQNKQNKQKNQNNINSKKSSMSNGGGKQNEAETELSSEEKNQNQNNLSSSKEYIIKVKKNLKDRLISVSSDLGEEKVQAFNGNVIDIKYISLRNYEQTVNILKNELKRKGVKYKKIDYNSYKCTKGIRQFYVDIVKIPKNIFYYRFYEKKRLINNFH